MSYQLKIIPWLLFANTVFAGDMGEPLINNDGFYIGADMGVADLIDSQSTSGPATAHQMSGTGIVGGGVIGYDYSITELFTIGLEGFINANGLNASNSTLSSPISTYKINARYNGGMRLLPGYQITSNTTTHLLIGYSNAQFNIKDTGDYGFINKQFNKSGFQCGLGMKTLLSSRLSIRADGLYTTYSRASNLGASNTVGYTSQMYHNNFNTLEGNLTLIYKFV